MYCSGHEVLPKAPFASDQHRRICIRTPVELLDRTHELVRLDALDVDDLGFHRPLDRSRQSSDRLARVVPMGRETRRHRDRLSEGDEHPPEE